MFLFVFSQIPGSHKAVLQYIAGDRKTGEKGKTISFYLDIFFYFSVISPSINFLNVGEGLEV